MSQVIRERHTASWITIIGLGVFFALGLIFVLGGLWGQRQLQNDSLGADGGYSEAGVLAGDVAGLWNGGLAADLSALSEAERGALNSALPTLLRTLWGAWQEGADAEADRLLAESTDAERTEKALRALSAYELVHGPKVPSAVRKALAALSADGRSALRRQLLRALTDESVSPPETVREALEGLTGTARQEMLLQLILTDLTADGQASDHVRAFKKAIRSKDGQLAAFRMMAAGSGGSRLRHWIAENGKTIVLLGVLLMLDVALLALLMAADRRWVLNVKWVLILLILDFMLVFLVLPVIYILIRGFFPEGSFSLSTVSRLFSDPMNLEALKNTLIVSFSAMILGTLIAFPLAWLVGRTNLYGRKFFRSLFIMTYMVPPYVGAMAWLRLMNPNVGLINQALRALLRLGDTPGPLNVYTLPGMIWVLTSFYYPYAFITISRAMEKMDPTLEEAGRISGATPLRTLWTVTLPMMTPSLIAGALLVFISAASCYGIPSIIGTPGNVNTVTTRIVEYVSLGQSRLNDAIALASFLLLIALIILFISDGVLAKKQYVTVSGKSTRPATVDLRRWRMPLTVGVSLFALFMVVLPFATILSTSFKVDIGKSVLDPANFTTANWTGVFSRSENLSSLKNSLIYASVTATVGLIIACVMGYLLQRTRIRGRSIPNFLITLASGTPSVVIALGLIMTMRGSFGIDIYNTAYILIVAYLIKYLMMGMRTVVSAMSQIHVSLEECSQVSGAGWLRTMIKITGPLIFPSIAAGWFLIFIPSFYELSMTTLLYSTTTKTIGFQLYEYWTYTSQPMSCAMAFGILMIVIQLNFILNRLTKGQFSI